MAHQWLIVERPVDTAVVCLVLHEVIGPDVVRWLRTQPGTGAVVEQEPGPFGCFFWDFQPIAIPDPLDPLVVRMPQPASPSMPEFAVNANFLIVHGAMGCARRSVNSHRESG